MDKSIEFKALRIHSDAASPLGVKAQMETQNLNTEISSEQVIIQAQYSCVNYKDALAVTGKGKILRRLPLTPGIDVAGRVYKSNSKAFKIGDSVLVNGCGLGETQDGGFSEYVTVLESQIVPLGASLNPRTAMILGTAGFTAALSLYRMETNGQTPELGPILVTGASGGVGMAAIQILKNKGYDVVALTHKKNMKTKLIDLGASEVILSSELKFGERPLESVRWAGAIDNLGGKTLSGISRHIQLWGNIACVGLAESSDLHTTVMPLILRGVSLLGSSSANCPMPLRKKIWSLLAKDWQPHKLEEMINSEITLENIPLYCNQLLNREKFGRALVQLS